MQPTAQRKKTAFDERPATHLCDNRARGGRNRQRSRSGGSGALAGGAAAPALLLPVAGAGRGARTGQVSIDRQLQSSGKDCSTAQRPPNQHPLVGGSAAGRHQRLVRVGLVQRPLIVAAGLVLAGGSQVGGLLGEGGR